MFPVEGAIKASFRLIQIKILHRTYYTRELLCKIGKTDSPLCLRGCGEDGTLHHTLWQCPKLQDLYGKAAETLGVATNTHIEKDTKMALLGVWNPRDLTKHNKLLVNLVFIVAKRDIAQKWDSATHRKLKIGRLAWTTAWCWRKKCIKDGDV